MFFQQGVFQGRLIGFQAFPHWCFLCLCSCLEGFWGIPAKYFNWKGGCSFVWGLLIHTKQKNLIWNIQPCVVMWGGHLFILAGTRWQTQPWSRVRVLLETKGQNFFLSLSLVCGIYLSTIKKPKCLKITIFKGLCFPVFLGLALKLQKRELIFPSRELDLLKCHHQSLN